MQFIKPEILEHPVDTAARVLGGRSVLARHLEVSVAALGNWKVRGVPIEQCPRIERFTGNVVTRQILRPNDWQEIWPELAQATVQPAQASTQSIASQGSVTA